MSISILPGKPAFLALEPGETLVVTADALSSGLVRRVTQSGGNRTGLNEQTVQASGTRIFGPFPTVRHYSIETALGALVYDVTVHQFGRSVLFANVEGFTGSRTLRQGDNGKLLRCD